MKKTSHKKDFFVVGIGASAGGLDAIQQLFDNVSSDTGMAFVIVQHLSPNFKSMMDELLAKHTIMPIQLASDGIELQPNHIYLNPKEKNIICKDRKIIHLDKDSTHPLNLPIDIFFHSLGNDIEHHAIGVILSGTGTDGSRGVSTIKESGGIVIVQEPRSAQFDGMPVTAINAQVSDYILKPEEIGHILKDIAHGPSFFIDTAHTLSASETYFNKIIEVLSGSSGIDFSYYKPNTIVRRIEKRINICKKNSLQEYYLFLKDNEEEQKTLSNDCLIGVTSFFRDPEAFDEIKAEVLPHLFDPKKPKTTVRLWIAGCSTGEEAYSFSLLIDEYLEEHKLVFDYKIFATDADSKAIQTASGGQYAINQIADISKKRLEKYFIKRGNLLEVSKRLREKIVFSTHNILKDPPFIRMDFISCRNLLIYMNNKSQRKITNTFQFALNLSGFLFLGNSENISEIKDRFEIVSSKWRIYRNISKTRSLPSLVGDGTQSSFLINHITGSDIRNSIGNKPLAEHAFNKNIAEHFGPSCIYLSNQNDILFLNGDISKYLSFNRGLLKTNLFDVIANEKLAAMFRNGLRRLNDENKTILFKNFQIDIENETQLLNIKFVKQHIDATIRDAKVIVIERADTQETNELVYDKVQFNELANQQLKDLERELKLAKEETQNVIEELETSNEELQASNEELQASNEELQSTNEELQSVNEELYTINSELQAKNQELYNLNNDMSNVLNNTNIALLFLDSQLNIRMFTPELKQVFNLTENDIDRPIDSFASNFVNISGRELAIDVKKVIEHGAPVSRELMSEDESIYLKRIMPYKTHDNKIEGAVITFLDITDIKQKENKMSQTNERLNLAMKTGNLAWWDWDVPSGIVEFSDAKALMLGYSPTELDKDVYAFTKMIHPNDYEKAMTAMREHLEGKIDSYIVEYRIKCKNGSYKWFFDKGGIVERDEDNKPIRVTGIVIDITENKKQENEITKLLQIFKQNPTPNIITDVNGIIEFANDSYCELSGYSRNDLIGKRTNILKSGKHDANFYKELWETISSKKIWQGEIANKTKDGKIYWEQNTIFPIVDHDNNITNFMKVAQDVTSQAKHKEKLKIEKLKAEEADKLKSTFLANMSHEIRTPMNAIVGFGQLLKDPELSPIERLEFINIINSQGDYLLSLINDIIDISKIEAGSIKLRNEICDLQYLMTDLERFFLLNKTNNVDIKFIGDLSRINPEIYTDATRLRQILTNLIGNAVKFTEQGSVNFGIELDSDNRLIFSIADTGIGIKSTDLEIIFNRFHQVSTINRTHQMKGTGLGLAITKALVELLDGAIWVKSEEYVGSTFYFSIPYNPVIHETKPIKLEEEQYEGLFKDRKFLIAEDIESNYQFLRHTLEPTGAITYWAKNGVEAIELLKNNPDISLVLLDISLPLLDGYEAASKIRTMNQSIPIIAQTAYAMEGDKEKALKAGCTAYLSKPIHISDLMNCVNKLLIN